MCSPSGPALLLGMGWSRLVDHENVDRGRRGGVTRDKNNLLCIGNLFLHTMSLNMNNVYTFT